MAEKTDEVMSMPVGIQDRGNEREPERKRRETTFDVYVGKIPSDWTKDKLMEIFQPFGEIKSLDLKAGQEFYNGQQIAFVRFSKEEMAKLAVDSLSGNPVENVHLQINMAQRSKYKEYKDRQSNLDFSQPRSRMYAELKRTNQADFRRGRTRQFGRYETDYGGGYGTPTYGQKKEWNPERQKSREEMEKVILVTEVETPVRFWGQVAKETVAHSLSTASEELQYYCPTGLRVADNSHQKNKIYGGLYPVDNLWYRCSIVKFLPQGMVIVRYVDFGNTETIRKDTLVELPPSLADARPFAQLFHLADCVVSTDPGANEMTYALGIEQLKNLIIGKLVTVKTLSENTHGGVNVSVSCPGEAGKTINEKMLDGGCVQRFRPRSDKGRIERSVAEKPLNEDKPASSPEKSPKDNQAANKQGIEGLKMTVKFQSETICNLNKLFETVKQQNDDLCLELDQAIKMKTILTAMTELRQSRSATACSQDRTANIDMAISLVTDTKQRFTLDRVESYKKLCSTFDGLRQAQESIKTCEDKGKLKEFIEQRNSARQELLENRKEFLEEISLLDVDNRGQRLEEALKNLSVFHHRYDGEESLEDAVKKYNNWKDKPKQNDAKSARLRTDDISRKIAGEFLKLAKMLNPDDDLTMEDCGTIDVNSLAAEYSAAVAAEIEQNQEGEDSEEIEVLAPLIKCLKKELQQEITDVKQLRSKVEECSKIQDDLETSMNTEPDVSKILEVRKNLKAVKSKFRHKLADKKDLEESDEGIDEKELKQVEADLTELRTQLHGLLVEEKIALEELAEVSFENFPELIVQYPEFGLQKFATSNGLVKQGWELTYYSHGEMEKVMTSAQGEVAFLTEFNGKNCVLKEFNLEDISDIDSFEAQAVAYSRIEHPNLMKVEALFYDKTHRKAFIQLGHERKLKNWLESSPSDKAKRDVLCDIIRALFALQKAGITHGSVVMDNIYVDDNGKGILGEYCFNHDTQQRVSLTAELLLQNSAPVSCDTSPVFDMFCLGEVAWLFFLGEEPMPRDLTSLQKHSQSKAISFILTYILALNGGARPTANQLIQHPFFTDQNYLDIMDKTAPHSEITPEETGEENTIPEESTLPDEDTPPAENTPSEESLEINTQPEVNTTSEVNTEPEESSLPEVSTPPAVSTVPDECPPLDESLIVHMQPLSANKSMIGTSVADEMPSMEEALPEEYSATQRKPLLPENGLKATETQIVQENTLQNAN